MTKHRAVLSRSLAASVAERPVPAILDRLAAIDPALQRFAEAAVWHRIPGFAWRFLSATSYRDTPGAARCLAAACDALAHHLRAKADLQYVTSVLQRAGIDALVIKGPVLAESVYAEPKLRSYLDVDLVVPPHSFCAAVEALADAGCRRYDISWAGLLRAQAAEIHLLAPNGSIIDLHWNVVGDARARRNFQLGMEQLFRDARSVDVGGRPVRTLSPVDTVVHLCVHAALSGADRLCWLTDIVRASQGIEWTAVSERARAWGLAAAVGTALARAQRVVGLPAPADVIAGLLGGMSWRSITALVDRFGLPLGTQPNSLARLTARAARRGAAQSTAEFVRRTAVWALHGGRHGGSDLAFEPDAEDPTDSADRDRYFRFVLAQR